MKKVKFKADNEGELNRIQLDARRNEEREDIEV